MKTNRSLRNPNSRLNTQIALASLTLGLSIIFLSLSYVIPGMSLLNMIIIPFAAAYFTLKSNYKGQLIYLFCTVMVCFIDFQEGFFNLLPNALIGVAYGNMFKYFESSFLTYFITLLFTFIIELVLIYPINMIFNVDMIKIYATLFNINIDIFKEIFLTFYFLLAVIQTLITFIIISNEIPKLNLKTKTIKINEPIEYGVESILCFVSISISYFYARNICYLSIAIFEVILCYRIILLVEHKNKAINIILLSLIPFSIIFFFSLASIFNKKDLFLLYLLSQILYFVVTFIMVIYYRIKKDKTPDSSEEKEVDLLDLKKGDNNA